MNKHLFLLAILAAGFTACGPVYVVQSPPPPADSQPAASDDATYQTFYDQLSPYGQWINDSDYGYVWMPEVSADFKPYATDGHWVYTDEGWTWDSDYAWGWAAFHYGRWFFKDGYGWMWLPGNEWAPAWVSWRNSDEYYGWAPLGPDGSFGDGYNGDNSGGGYGDYNPPAHYWCFVPHAYVASPHLNNYYVRETNNVTIINRTTIINNTTVINNSPRNNRPRNGRFGAGPDPSEVGRFTGAPLRPVPIKESRAPGRSRDAGSITLYRPHVNTPPAGETQPGFNNGNGGRPAVAPAHVQSLDNARPVNRTNYGNNPPGNNRPANNPPANNRPAGNPPAINNNPPVSNRPANNPPAPNNNPPANNRPTGNPANNPPPATRTSPGFSTNPANNRPVNNFRPSGQAATPAQPSITQPAVPNRPPVTRRPLTPNVNPNQPRPVGNTPKPAPPQHNPPPPPKKDGDKTANKP